MINHIMYFQLTLNFSAKYGIFKWGSGIITFWNRYLIILSLCHLGFEIRYFWGDFQTLCTYVKSNFRPPTK